MAMRRIRRRDAFPAAGYHQESFLLRAFIVNTSLMPRHSAPWPYQGMMLSGVA